MPPPSPRLHRHAAHAQQLRSPTPPQPPHHPAPRPQPHLANCSSTAPKPRAPSSNTSRPASANGLCAPHESARGRTLAYEDLSRCFHLPINTAAKELGVCVTALKKQCRKHHIKRWPHRKLKSLDKLKEKLEKEEANAADKEYYKHEIHSIAQKKDHIFRSGTNRELAKSERRTPPPEGPARPSQPFPPHEHTRVHGHPPLVISTPVPLPGRTVTLSASHPPPPQGVGPPTLTPVAIPASPISMCGVLGCDCYMNGGVSTQNYHMPLPTRPPLQASNGSLVPAVPLNVSAPMHANGQFYGTAPPPYSYATALPYPPPQHTPFQNMVQVNVLEQQPYGHQPAPTSNPSQASPSAPRSAPPNGSPVLNGSPNMIQAGPVAVSQSPTPNPTPNPSGYEMYPPTSNGTMSQPSGGFLYGSFSPHTQVPVEGVVQGAQSNGSAAQLVPHYWTEPPHTSNRNNLVTMYNQTTHYHHHHPAHARSAAGGLLEGTASSATNNSDAAASRRDSIHISRNGGSSAPTRPGLSSQNVVQRPAESASRKRGPSPSETPSKFAKVDGGEPTAHAEGGKMAGTNNRGECRREPLKAGPMQKPTAAGEFKVGSRISIANARHVAEMRKENPPVVNKGVTKPAEPQPRVARMAQRHTQRDGKAPVPPHIVGHVSPRELAARGVPLQNGENNSVNGTVADSDRMEAMRSDNGHILNRIALQAGSRRSPHKRPRNGRVESPTKPKPWEGSYFTAGNTGVPAVRHAEGAVPGIREITPPSDREETPFDPRDNLGSGSGTGSGSGSGSGSGNENDNADGSGEGDGGSGSGDGTGSGSGDGTGSGSGEGSGSGDGTGSGGDGTGSGDGSGSGDSDGSKEDRRGRMDPPSPMRNGLKRRANKHAIEWRMNGREDGVNVGVPNGVVSGSASGNLAVVRARRYEHVVHHCVSLLCAQWCTDKNFRVTISLGSKVLLGLAGIGGHGRNIFEGIEGMLESKHSMQKRYTSVLKGQRMEWVATDGRKRYLVVLSPFRKRSGSEISGVSGLLMELTQAPMSS